MAISLNNKFWEHIIRSRFPDLKHEASILRNARKVYLRIRKIVADKRVQFEQIVQAVQNCKDSDADKVIAASRDIEDESMLDSNDNLDTVNPGSSFVDQDLENIETNQGVSEVFFPFFHP